MQTLKIAIHRELWADYIAAVDSPECESVITSPEMMEVGIWMATQKPQDWNEEGVAYLDMPFKLATYLVGSCCLFSQNKFTRKLAPWADIGHSLHPELYFTIQRETMRMLEEKDYSDKGFPCYRRNNYSDN